MEDPVVVFAGDRDIAVDILNFLLDKGVTISALFLPDSESGSHDIQLRRMCDDLEDNYILRGDTFHKEKGQQLLNNIQPDYIISIHFQYLYPKPVLDIPTEGVVNLHPAFLPYNRGWHTPSWAIWEQTPYGATLHFMDEEVDQGEIIARERLEVRPEDTANSLYNRVKKLEFELFKDTWPKLADFSYETHQQSEEIATYHGKSDLDDIQKIELDQLVKVEDLIQRLRALTTNKIEEAAYFEQDGEKYRIQVEINPEDKLS